MADGDLFEPVVTMETVEEGRDHQVCTHIITRVHQSLVTRVDYSTLACCDIVILWAFHMF